MTPPYAELTDRGGYDSDELDAIAAGETHGPMRGISVCVTHGYNVENSGGWQAEGIVYASGGRVLWCTMLVNHGGNDPIGVVRAKCEAWIAADDVTRAKFSSIERWGGGLKNSVWRTFGVAV